LGKKKARAQIGGSNGIPSFRGPVSELRAMGDPGIGDQNVETLVTGNNRSYCGIRGTTVGHIKHRSFGIEAAITKTVGGTFSVFASRPLSTTVAPASANASAIARPSPREARVTSATFLLRSK
jgi:hypothetical protein